MKQQHFEKLHQARWQALEENLNRKPVSTTAEKTMQADFIRLYRQVCRHLALARQRRYTPYLVQRLNRLVLLGHQELYSARRDGILVRITQFVGGTFPQQVRRDWRFVAVSSLLFFGPLLLMALSIQLKPVLIYSLLDAATVSQIESMYEPGMEHIGRDRDAGGDLEMFGFYIRNNIGIAFQTFAGGLLLCLGSLFFLVYNGLFIGAVMGHLHYIGYRDTFYTFVAGHSALELGGIALAGAAGLKLGMALLAPGRLSRLHSLRLAAEDALVLVYGFAGMLLLAAFIEAFWSSNGSTPAWIKYSVGMVILTLLIAYFIFAGRQKHAAR